MNTTDIGPRFHLLQSIMQLEKVLCKLYLHFKSATWPSEAWIWKESL